MWPEAREIEEVAQLIEPYIRLTPVLQLDARELGLPQGQLALKLELLQHSGSFKARGAFTNLLRRAIPASGVAAASGGNHGAAVAYAAMRLEVPARIFVPTTSSPAKIERIRSYGADLVVKGDTYADALSESNAWLAHSKALSVHAFDQPETILGQATLAMELERQAPRLDTLLVSVGGGGLIAGIAAWYRGRVKVIGVEPEASPTLSRALTAGRPVDAEVGGIAVDSLAPRRVGEHVFPIARRHVHQVILVTDDAIREAQATLWNAVRVVAEPGGAAALSALLSGAYRPAPGEHVGAVISGGNTTAVNL
jgi:threonine dehydratase